MINQIKLVNNKIKMIKIFQHMQTKKINSLIRLLNKKNLYNNR